MTTSRVNMLPLAAIAGIVLAGYWPLFGGADFFVDEDAVTIWAYAQGNAAGNGWRPDKALGTSFFFGDPGAFHAWSPLSLLSRAFESGRVFYTCSVVVLLIAAAFAQYALLRRVAPRIGAAAWLLAPVIVFGPAQHEFFFQRTWIALSIGVPLFILLLDDYAEEPRPLRLIYAVLLCWFTWFFGSIAAFTQTLIVGGVFALVRARLRGDGWQGLRRGATLCAAGVAGTALLGAWVFYSILIEIGLSSYARAPQYFASNDLVDVGAVVSILGSWFHSGVFDGHLTGVTLTGVVAAVTSWANVSPLFPLVLVLVVTRKRMDFWTSALKWTLLLLMANELLFASPAYGQLLQRILPFYPLQKFQPAYHCLQIALIGCVLADLAPAGRRFADAASGTAIRRVLAVVLASGYASLAMLAAFSLAAPRVLQSVALALFDRISPTEAAGTSKDVLREVLAFDIGQVTAAMHWPFLLFYGLMATVMVTWIRRPSLLSVSRRSVTGFAVLVLATGLLLSWAVYPLNRKPLVWDGAAGQVLAPTDRLYVFFDARYQAIERTVAGFRRQWVDNEFGLPEARASYMNGPALNLSGAVSYWPVDQAAYVSRAFQEAHVPLAALRDLKTGPFAPSPLLDMAAVSHFASWRPLPERLGFPLEYKAKQLYVYRNPAAWPYIYLADRLEPITGVADLPSAPQRGTAYLAAREMRPLQGAAGGRVALTAFSPGRIELSFDSPRDEFLTIADGWHPYWRARIDGAPVDVVKSNAVFKGAWIPAGRHRIEFYFDTAPFMPGVYISIAAWAALAAGAAWAVRRQRRLPAPSPVAA